MKRGSCLESRRSRADDPATGLSLEAVSVTVGRDLVVVVAGGTGYHVGASALAISIPQLKDPSRRTNSSYLAAVPGHKEEQLARDGALRLSRELARNVVMTVGIHDDGASRARIEGYVALFQRLLDEIVADHRAAEASGEVQP